MSATVATAKLRSARCDRSDRPPRCLAFIYSSHLGPADGQGRNLGPIDGSAGDSPWHRNARNVLA